MSAAKNKKFRPPQPKQTPALAEPAVSPSPAPLKPMAQPAPTPPIWQVLAAALLIVLAGLGAYSNSFKGDFVLDDLPAIKENATIQNGWDAPPRSLNPPSELLERLYQRLPLPLQPPNDGQTVTGRPLVNASFAWNFAWAKTHSQDGFAPGIYHVTSLTIHLLAGLTLFGLVRRTLELPKLRAQFAGAALPIALVAALLWTVHPLQTESVTYLSQRAESLMGLFYLLTLYCFVRGTQSRPWLWFILAALTCATATFCKEVTVTLPVVILLFDYVFVAQNPRELFRRRWPVYLGLLLALLPLAFLVLHAGDRGRSAGAGLGVTRYDYAVAQFPAIVNYLKQAFWPHPLVLDYGDSVGLADQPYTTGDFFAMAAVMALVAGTIYLLWRKPLLGFLGAWFFIILAPSSSILPIITEPAAEHRMYLPLAALMVLAALGLWRLLGRRAVPATLALALALGALTFARNHDYRSGLDLWRDTVTKHPGIARAHENYGIMLYDAGHARESVGEYETALRLKPNYPDCDNNLGNALGTLGENEEAVKHYLIAANNLLRPGDQAVASYNMGNALRALGRWDDALTAYNYAGNLAHYGPAFNNMGSIYSQFKNNDQAIAAYTKALYYQPIFPLCEVNLANSYAETGQPGLAEQHYLRAIQEDPNYAEAYYRLGLLYAMAEKFADAVRQLAVAARLVPASPEAHYNLGICLVKVGQLDDAAREFETVLQINPHSDPARAALAQVRAAGANAPTATGR